MSDDHDLPDPQIERKPFAQALQEMRKGGLHTEMSDELAALVRKVMQTGKKGTIKLTLTVERLSDGVTVAIADKVESKLPRFDTDATLYWPDSDGNLYRNRPDQPELPLREINGANVDPATGEVKPLREAGPR